MASIISSDEDSDLDDTTVLHDLRNLPKIRGFDQALSLEIGYVPHWTFRDAFRELVQNWADGMKDSNKLCKRNFTTQIVDTEKQWLARALHPDTRLLLGYIRFNKGKGLVELTNFDAQLARRTLNMGGGDKQHKAHLAGGHGEGYKAAAVVALRRGYQIRYESSSCYWTFHVGKPDRDPEQIYCKLKPMRPKPLEKVIKEYADKFGTGSPRQESNFIHQDVSVKIGNVYNSKDYAGRQVTRAEFRELIKISLDLIPPATMIATPHGELIVDKAFQDTTYLKRLLVEGNPGMAQYKFGYHFFEGNIDRDRRRLPNTKSDAKRGAQIWECVIEKHPKYLDTYIKMIEDEDTAWADVHRAEDFVSRNLAEKMSKYYFAKDVEKKIFYHDSRNSDKDIEIITRSLRKTPKQLVPEIWDILRKYNFVRTPEEEQIRLLDTAPEAVDIGSSYSESIKRALTASLQLDSRTKSLQLSFRSGAKADLDMLLSGATLKINELWLDFSASHEKSPCYLSRKRSNGVHNTNCFSCHHVVLRLHELILEELARHSGTQTAVESADSLNQRVRENLSQMPIMIKASPGKSPCSIDVSWIDLDPVTKLHGLHPKCCVTLHRESSCSLTRTNLIAIDSFDETTTSETDHSTSNFKSTAPCGCPLQIVLPQIGNIVFHGLNPEEKYFPMVARAEAQAFYGLPPKAVRPSPTTLRSSLRISPTPEHQEMENFDGIDDIHRAASLPAPNKMSTKPQAPKTPQTQNRNPPQTSPVRTTSSVDTNTPEFKTPKSFQTVTLSGGPTPTPTTSPTLTDPDSGVDKATHRAQHPPRLNPDQLKNTSLRKRISTLEQELRASRTENEQAQRQLSVKTKELKATSSDLDAVRLQLTTIEQTLKHRQTEDDELRSQLATKTEEIKSTGLRLDAAHQRLTAADQMLKRFETERERLRGQLTTKTEETRTANLEIDAVRQKLGTETDFKEALEEEVTRLQTQVEQLHTQLQSRKGDGDNKLATLESENVHLRKSIESVNETLPTTRSSLEITNSLVKDLQIKDIDLSTTLETLRSDVMRLQATNEQLEADLDIAQEINGKQAQLAANRVSRMRAPTDSFRTSNGPSRASVDQSQPSTTESPRGIKREVKQEDVKPEAFRRQAKRVRTSEVIEID